MHLHIRTCVSLISISRFTHFLRFSVCLFVKTRPTKRPFKAAVRCSLSEIVVFSQILCSAQVAPAEVSGHQESNQKRSDGGAGKRGIHESGQTQIGSCKLSSVFFVLFCYFLHCFK